MTIKSYEVWGKELNGNRVYLGERETYKAAKAAMLDQRERGYDAFVHIVR